jgi:predicted TIM-barrel fold metal-dependent hydrolase
MQEATRDGVAREVAVDLIDCDAHPYLKHPDELRQYMREPWRSRTIPSRRQIFLPPGDGRRLDALPEDGSPAGSDPKLVETQVLQGIGADYVILIPSSSISIIPDPVFAAEVAQAWNDWQIDTWLGEYNWHGRFKSSIVIAPQHPEQAVREIERLAGHPHLVQILVGSSAQAAYGKRQYHPIWAAAARHNLPVALHVESPVGPTPPTPLGYPTYFLEFHTLYPTIYMTHLVSLIAEGVFEKYPDFKFVFVEGGSAWLAPIMWRMDKDWRGARAEVPWLKRRPSEYLREHIRFSTQPIEEPENPRHLLQIFEMMDAQHVLMFASDYPHWDFDDPKRAFPRLPDALKRRIFCENARELYYLPATRPADSLDTTPSLAETQKIMGTSN